ncbi:MAG: hypothetical protein ABW131_04095 [Candidatus Sedimenticola sp. 6PFRAG5]
MAEQKFRLTLTGRIVEGFEHKEVAEALGKLLKVSIDQARGMLQGRRSRIRAELTLEKAEHLQQKLMDRGAVCNLSPVPSAGDKHEASPEKFLADQEEKSTQGDGESGFDMEFELVPQEEEDGEEAQDNDDTSRLNVVEVEPEVQAEDTEDTEVVLSSTPEKPAQEQGASTDQDSGTAQFFEEPRVIADKIEKNPQKALPYLLLVGILVIGGLGWVGFKFFMGPDKPAAAKKPVSQNPVVQVPVNPELDLSNKRLGLLARSVKVWMIQYGSGFNPEQVTLSRLGEDLGMPKDEFLDGWGNAIRYEPGDGGYKLRSPGADGTFGTEDDLLKTGQL